MRATSTIRRKIYVAAWIIAVIPPGLNAEVPEEAGRHLIEVVSTIDGTHQPSYLILPAGCLTEQTRRGGATPLFVGIRVESLHQQVTP